MKNNIPDKSVVSFDRQNPSPLSSGGNVPLSRYVQSSPYPDEDVSFNWMTCAYPYFHRHDYFEILVVVNGEVVNEINGSTHIMRKGDACLIRPDDVHRLLSVDNTETGQHLNFLLKYNYAKFALDGYKKGLAETLGASRNTLNFKISLEYLTKLTNTCLATQSNKIPKEEKTLQCKIMIERLLNSFMERKFSILPVYPEWFPALLYVLNDPHSDITVEELAKTTSYSYSRLSRIFKDLMGMGIVEYARNIKMDYAAELLKNTDKPVTQIVEEINYSSISYFNRAFKETFGITPTAMRTASKKSDGL